MEVNYLAEYEHINTSYPRKDGIKKVNGEAKYTDDYKSNELLHAAILTSPHAHAKINSINTEKAEEASGVRAVVTGKDFDIHTGIYLGDKRPLAKDKVRHYGERVAAVIADTEHEAEEALDLIEVDYETLEPVSNPKEALKENTPILHENMEDYETIPAIHPEPGTNVGNRTKIRKGDTEKGFEESDVIIEDEFEFKEKDHVAMEPRVTIAEIDSDDQVIVRTASQSPFVVRHSLSLYFDIPHNKIKVKTPFVGGGFGGKAGIYLEALAYLLSKKVNGRPVRLANSREEDLVSSPGSMGFEGEVKIGATEDGDIKAADFRFLFDSGAYADYAVNISRAAAVSCTGPYGISNVKADSLCVYTNHPYATAFRGFGHIEQGFAIERALDLLAKKIDMDPAELRIKNAIREGDTTPTDSPMDNSTGDLPQCIENVKDMLNWDEGQRIEIEDNKIRAKGIGSLWKTPIIPPNTRSSIVVMFNEDGSVNVTSGITEIGSGSKTGLAQLIAERLSIDPSKVNIVYEVDTDSTPYDWETAASRSLFMGGKAALKAVDSAIKEIKEVASEPLRCSPDDLKVSDGRVFIETEPEEGYDLSEVVKGYMYPNGESIGGQVIGSGSYISNNLSEMDPDTGEGNPWLEYTLGAEGVEVEVDLRDGTYKILKSVNSMDVGQVVNPQLARGQVVGGMEMGIGYARTEGLEFGNREQVLNDVLRDYKIPRYGEDPEYGVEFVETPQINGPYGVRGLGEPGIVGIPGALSNALSKAIGKEIKELPITPEKIWRKMKEEKE